MKIHIKIHIAVFALILSGLAIFQVMAAFEPGSEQDPIVSKSYVDAEINKLNQTITGLQTRIAQLEAQQSSDGGAGTYKVVSLTKGQKLIVGNGTEVILRAGDATAISGMNGDGLADVTSGKAVELDLKTGDKVEENHLLISSRDDGRGLLITSNTAYLLVKGSYIIV